MKRYFTITDLSVDNKYVIVRVDYNIVKGGKVIDNTRIKATLETINHLLKNNAMIILMSHLGRPKGFDPKISLKPVIPELKKLIKKENGVYFLSDCVGTDTENFIDRMIPGEIVLLENLRFYKEEKDNDPVFAQSLANLADYYVNDAFGACHRAHASVDAVTNYLPSASGFLVEKEIKALSTILKPKKPFIAVLGGAKISDKIETIEALAAKSIKVIIGGAMANAFLKAKGLSIGTSKTDAVEIAEKILKRYHEKIVLPVDVVIANKFDKDAKTKTVSVNRVPKEWMILDIGPETIELFKKELKEAKTIFWNGPLGVFEFPKFSKGTEQIAMFIANKKAIKVVGGGDTGEVIAKLKLHKKFTHVSAGGGAALEFFGR